MEITQPSNWNILKKFSFIFCFIFFTFVMLPFPFNLIPVDIIAEFFARPWEILIPWTATNVFGITELNMEPGGSGDATLHYIQLFLWIIFSLAGSMIWIIADRRRTNYDKFYNWFIIVVRLFLANTIMQYGFAKVFISQFPFPSYRALEQPLSDFSPMGLAWAFMGYSPAYSIFTGSLEVIAGALFLSRRTTLLASCMTFAVMLNVVAMNFCFDIPVKLFSSQLLLMAVYVAAPDFNRLLSFFVLNRPVHAKLVPQLIIHPRIKKIAMGGMYSAFFLGFGFSFYSNYEYAEEYHKTNAQPDPLKGIYMVKEYRIINDSMMPDDRDSLEWKKIIIEQLGYAHITLMSDETIPFKLERDSTDKNQIFMTSLSDTSQTFKFHYLIKNDNLNLNGTTGKDSVIILTKRKNISSSPLISRGFHWINEYPFNR